MRAGGIFRRLATACRRAKIERPARWHTEQGLGGEKSPTFGRGCARNANHATYRTEKLASRCTVPLTRCEQANFKIRKLAPRGGNLPERGLPLEPRKSSHGRAARRLPVKASFDGEGSAVTPY